MSLDVFLSNFYDQYTEILSQLNELNKDLFKNETEQEQKAKLTAKYESVSQLTEQLQKYFTENSSSIPLYEVRKAQEHLAKLNKASQEKRDELFPKKKFGFKSKQNMTSLQNAVEAASAEVAAPVEPKKAETNNVSVECSVTLRNLNDEKNFIKKEFEINGQDVALIDVKNSIIQIFGNPSVVHMSNIESSTILIGPIKGPAFLNHIRNSRIVISSHQLRIHETHDTDFYFHVGSRAIIENCKNVSFAPYAWSYPGLVPFVDVNWTSIDDFNWLNQGEKSPNWSFLDEAKRVKWTSNDQNELTESQN
jgi:hypothetical protein